jgi:hypothetical protein
MNARWDASDLNDRAAHSRRLIEQRSGRVCASWLPCPPISLATLTQMKEAPSRLTESGLSDPKGRLFRLYPKEWARRGLSEAALHIPAIGETLQLP